MNILPGKLAENHKEATKLAFQTAGVEGTNADIIDMFTSLANDHKVSSEADKTIGASIRNRYGNKASWRAERWFVPVPELRYEGKDIPQLIIEITMYLVAAALVKTQHDSRLITLVGPVGKPEALAMPMIFLHAVLDGDLGRFNILAKSGNHTTWEILGAKPVQLPNDLVNRLAEIFTHKSVAAWLEEFASQGRSIMPLVVGSLFGLEFRGSAQTVPPEQQSWTADQLVKALEGMAYTSSEARELVDRVAPSLRVDYSLEEAIRLVLQQAGKGG